MNPRIRHYKNGIYVVSPSGYLVDYCRTKDYAWSQFEVDLSQIGNGGRLDRLSKEIEKTWAGKK